MLKLYLVRLWLFEIFILLKIDRCTSGCRVVNVFDSQTKGRGSCETSTGWFKEANSRVIYLCCENLFHNLLVASKINIFALMTNHCTVFVKGAGKYTRGLLSH